MQEYSPNESQYSKQQIWPNHRKLKKQKQNIKIDVWIIMQTDTERERIGNECLIFSITAGEAWKIICGSSSGSN